MRPFASGKSKHPQDNLDRTDAAHFDILSSVDLPFFG